MPSRCRPTPLQQLAEIHADVVRAALPRVAHPASARGLEERDSGVGLVPWEGAFRQCFADRDHGLRPERTAATDAGLRAGEVRPTCFEVKGRHGYRSNV